MKKAFIFSFLALFIAMTGLSTDADAKRFGGGKSFGKSFSKQKSFSSSSSKKSLTGQKAGAGAKAGSRAGGMMGILGGLAMGGLLGAMFFGGGFEGINFMDILIIAGIGFAIFWFMRRARASRPQRPEYAHAGHTGSPLGDHEENTNNDAFTGAETSSGSALKPEIDHEHFVGAARDIFMRMQADWDAKNIEDIKAFCTPEVASRVLADMEEAGESNSKTEVGMLDANVADTWIESDLEWVAVNFQAMLKEETLDAAGQVSETNNSEVNEVWIFQHNPNNEDPTWYLSGIQQG
ncbi:MAG: TIM44-like domain-containing protein [Ghiorsea sp.]